MASRANVSDEWLAEKVAFHRGAARQTPTMRSTPAQTNHYQSVQNTQADVYQELLDRRREEPVEEAEAA